jgi:hypothetical protein
MAQVAAQGDGSLQRSLSPTGFLRRTGRQPEQSPAGLHPTPDVAKGGHRIGKEHHTKSAESKVDGLGLEAMSSRVVQDKLHLRIASGGNALAGQSQLLIRNVNAEYSAARPDRIG